VGGLTFSRAKIGGYPSVGVFVGHPSAEDL